MIRFLARRLVMALGILLTISVAVYAVLTVAMDPLDDLRQSTAPNKEQLIASRVRQLRLNDPWYERYWSWLTHFVRGDLGTAWRSQQPVADMIPNAVATSVHLIFAATVIATLVGITIGVVSALRQYTAFDYAIVFVSFVLFALPIFWVAVLLKEYLAIGLNDYLADPHPNWPAVAVVSVISGMFWAGALGGRLRRQAIVFASAFAVTFATLAYILTSGWLQDPALGIVGVALVALATAVAVSVIMAGTKNRRALGAALVTAVIGIALYMPLQYLFAGYEMTSLFIFGLLLVALAVAALVGWLFGGPDRGVSIRAAMIVAFVTSVAVYIDQVMQVWKPYVKSPAIHGRPIATIGSSTPNLGGDYWVRQLDQFTHLLLPSVALILISFATYTRYERGATLEVLNQDYIRTARAKGLPERVVIIRHALRNALMPLASIIPVDIVALVGGAVLTETIFGWGGMGRMFVSSLGLSEIDPVMTYVMITGALAMVANLIADFLYALLDPRIRVTE